MNRGHAALDSATNMAIGLTPKASWPFILKEDLKRPPAQQTVFHLRSLDSEERAWLEDNSISADGYLRLGKLNLHTLRAGLNGWENLLDENGQPIAFEMGTEPEMCLGKTRCVPTPRCIDRLTPMQIREVAVAIRDGQHITAADAKNSQLPPSLSSAAPPVHGTADAVGAVVQALSALQAPSG